MKNNKGFSLVELIVVIAIMAILAAVAVVGFSMYIPKAQQATDKQMVADIEYVLSLHAQSNPNDVTAGYIILTPNGAEATSGFATDVLVATYGEDWPNELKLAYGEWTTDGMLDLVAKYEAADLQLVANSSFMNSDTQGLLNAVTGMTGLIGDVIQDRGQDDPEEARRHLGNIFGADSDIVAKYDDLKASGLTQEEEATAISNMLVGTMADTIGDSPAMQTMLNMYTAAYNYAQETGDDAALVQMQTNLQNLQLDVLSPAEGEFATEEDRKIEEANKGLAAIMAGIEENEGEVDNPYAGFIAHLESNSDEILNDNDALSVMMGAVQEIANDYQDKESLTNSNLFASDAVASQVNNYLNSVKALAGIGDLSALKNLDAGSVVILIAADGTVSVVPTMD